jgi:hypothetical protein
MAGGWTLEDLPWDRFDPARVDRDILRVVKAASMIESNGGDYATYLCKVFSDDAAFQAAARAWAQEEVQHGQALARWARLADPAFDSKAAFKRFTEGYSLPLEAAASVRGSRAGELVARCIVEVATSSYYAALHDASGEPLLKEICKRISADELRHYKLFYTHLKRYLESERIGRWRRLLVALGRIAESGDDELAYAYYAANAGGEAYDRKRWSRAYLSRACGYYRLAHVQRAVAMTFKAAGLKPQGHLSTWAAWAAYRLLHARSRRPVPAGT